MIELYATLVKEGVRTLESVPAKYRLEVEKIIKEQNETAE